MIHKAYFTRSKAIDEGKGIYEVMASTETIDRDGDKIMAAGIDIDNYMGTGGKRGNRVVLWAHDYRELPIAKTLELHKVPGLGLRATFQFPEWGVSTKADQVRKLWA